MTASRGCVFQTRGLDRWGTPAHHLWPAEQELLIARGSRGSAYIQRSTLRQKMVAEISGWSTGSQTVKANHSNSWPKSHLYRIVSKYRRCVSIFHDEIEQLEMRNLLKLRPKPSRIDEKFSPAATNTSHKPFANWPQKQETGPPQVPFRPAIQVPLRGHKLPKGSLSTTISSRRHDSPRRLTMKVHVHAVSTSWE